MTGNLTPKERILKDCLLLLLLAGVIYLPFLSLAPWSENEPIRVIIAKDMLKTGNWLIPKLHGKPYFVKPPLMNWLIALSGAFFGSVNEWTSRLPSVISTFLTGISIYFLTAGRLGRDGRFFASVATLAMGGLIEKGRTAGIDSLFIFSVTIALLVWINGYLKNWRPVLLWCAALFLLSISFLAKGPQSIAYFYTTVFAYLAIRKRPSFFLSKAHLPGIGLLVLILGIYLLSILRFVSLDEYLNMWINQILQRSVSKHPFSFIEHFFLYPLSVAGAFMPWILFIVPAVFFKGLKGRPEIFKNEIFVFSLVMVAVNFPVYWLLPRAKVRYFLPAAPFVAIIAAVFFEFYLARIKEIPGIDLFFKRLVKAISWVALVFALMTPFISSYTGLKLSFPSILPPAVLIFSCVTILSMASSAELKNIPVYLAVIVGLSLLVYSNLSVAMDSQKTYYPRNIAREINLVLPGDVTTVYEMGYRTFLEVTCYIEKDVVEIDSFSALKEAADREDGVFFIFDARFLNSAKDKDILLKEIKWEKVYSKYFDEKKGEIVLGYIKGNKPLP